MVFISIINIHWWLLIALLSQVHTLKCCKPCMNLIEFINGAYGIHDVHLLLFQQSQLVHTERIFMYGRVFFFIIPFQLSISNKYSIFCYRFTCFKRMTTEEEDDYNTHTLTKNAIVCKCIYFMNVSKLCTIIIIGLLFKRDESNNSN